jgi:hypothetical protein
MFLSLALQYLCPLKILSYSKLFCGFCSSLLSEELHIAGLRTVYMLEYQKNTTTSQH